MWVAWLICACYEWWSKGLICRREPHAPPAEQPQDRHANMPLNMQWWESMWQFGKSNSGEQVPRKNLSYPLNVITSFDVANRKLGIRVTDRHKAAENCEMEGKWKRKEKIFHIVWHVFCIKSRWVKKNTFCCIWSCKAFRVSLPALRLDIVALSSLKIPQTHLIHTCHHQFSSRYKGEHTPALFSPLQYN